MRKIILVTLLSIVSIVGVMRLGFDTDILGMLPEEVPEVHGLKAQRDVLERGGALIITLECGEDDAGLLEDEAESLADFLKKTGVVGEVRWRPVFEDDPDGLGELMAYLWINGDSKSWDSLISSLEVGKSKEHFQKAIRRLGTVMDMSDMQLASRDPLGFFNHDSARIFKSCESEDGGYGSEDGMMQLVFARPAEPVSGYKATQQWIDQVKHAAEQWRESGDHAWIEIAYTGGPVFTSEVGEGMEKDVRGTVGLTMLLVSLLFWWMQRSLKLLFTLAGMLVLIFTITLGLASFIYGELSMLSVGFASILIGLAVDYGMVVCQEARVSGKKEAQLRTSVTKGITWAALTTAAVFAALCLSSLPSVRQLGVLVALGILAGAVVMLALYIPIVSRMKISPIILNDATSPSARPKLFLPPRFASSLLILVLSLSSLLVLIVGLPKITFDLSVMQPKDSPGMDALNRIKKHMPAWNSLGVQVVVEADTDDLMLKRLRDTQRRVDSAVLRKAITQGDIPVGLWPNAAQQKKNRNQLGALLACRQRLVSDARDAGFSDEGMQLSLSVFDALERFNTQKGVIYPKSQAALEILQSYLWRNPKGGGLVKGRIITEAAAEPTSDDLAVLRQLNGEGAYTSGWSLLSPALLPLIYRDVTHIFVPMGGILLVMLMIVFRDSRDVALVSCCLATPMLVLIVGMRVLGIDWDILNIIAIPLLLGMGMDYGIHMVMSLRRYPHNPEKVWHGIGKALIFCGTSTAIGFGSLAMASNEALAGMGILCAIGILLTMLCSVFILPGARMAFRGQ